MNITEMLFLRVQELKAALEPFAKAADGPQAAKRGSKCIVEASHCIHAAKILKKKIVGLEI